ncbi:MAG: ribosome-associated translation inhibitor RaiA [Sulfurospirillaceae bacterium]|jgi:putative sigma-54 modulation protein|nr:ribosome-associated translation inhibitor RaiA [Sulfurospirillaceae bacterium]MDY0238898.1 ribosome-associated translation inhibitor RaiA [Campylobacterales bacterium]NLM98441.1 ribosome-associated translation inhibitor RaiA [Campylobacteraceae bacterium]
MNTSIVGKQFELTDAIKNYIESGFDALGIYNLDIISTRALITADEKKGRKGFGAEIIINLAHSNTVVIKEKDKDLYAAIDLAIDRAKKVLRRHHDKITTHKGKADTEVVSVKEAEEALEGVDEIVPTELELYKPMEIDEALKKLKDSGRQFLVFNDLEAKMRVLYKRSDEKFGLY